MCSTSENWQAFEIIEAYRIKEATCPRQVKQIPFELIACKVFRTCSCKILYAKGVEESGRSLGSQAASFLKLAISLGRICWPSHEEGEKTSTRELNSAPFPRRKELRF